MSSEPRHQGEITVSPRARRLIGIVCAATLGIYLAFGSFVAINIHDRLDPSGAPVGYDFSAFYEAARFAKDGRAAEAYDDDAMLAAERAAFPGVVTRLPWNYPPTFQLLLLPLAALPYLAAWFVWSAALYALYVLVARSLVPAAWLGPLLVAPAAAINLLVGQNGLLSVALITGGTLLLGRRPFVAGMVLGLMAYKPHFAVLIPLALLCGREWRALGGAFVSGVGLVALSAAVLGGESWVAFLHNKAGAASTIFHSSSSNWRSIPSTLIMARSLGLGPLASAAAHWSVAVLASIGTLWIWWKPTNLRVRAAALATGTLLVTPYLRIYDLALLAVPIGALLSHADIGSRTGTRAILFAAWILPAWLLFTNPQVQAGAMVIVLTMGLVLRAAVRPDAAAARSRP